MVALVRASPEAPGIDLTDCYPGEKKKFIALWKVWECLAVALLRKNFNIALMKLAIPF